MKPSVSITCITTKDYEPTFKSLKQSLQVLQKVTDIDKVYWFSNKPLTESISVPVNWIYINSFRRFDWPSEYNYVSLNVVPQNVDTDFNFYIQGDGMAVNAEAWTDEFFNYDYIGARWHFLSEFLVGNGGFSLRSKKLYRALCEIKPAPNMRYSQFEPSRDLHQLEIRAYANQAVPEDNIICIYLKKRLEQEFGVRFATPEIADRFSIEDFWDTECPWRGKSLGFHGRHGIHHEYGIDWL